jgi:hypothetical protein
MMPAGNTAIQNIVLLAHGQNRPARNFSLRLRAVA